MRGRLAILYFLQFAVWGCYLSTLGQMLGAAGLGTQISWFYAAIGVVSVITPAFMGQITDRYVAPSRLLGACHVTASMLMMSSWIYATSVPEMEFGVFFPLYLGFLAFYMPTMALANTTTFAIIKSHGEQPEDHFPAIRVWGTIGFILALWMVNCTYWHAGTLGWTFSDSHPLASFRFQFTPMQLFCASCFGLLAGIYAFTLPSGKRRISAPAKPGNRFGFMRLNILSEFMCTHAFFLIFVALIGVCMQISNGFATPFISHFMGTGEYSGSFAAGNASMLFSLSQVSEAICILFVGKALKRYGIGIVFGIGMLAWGLRFLFFGIGNPGDGLVFLILSMIVYGFAFNFITIAGHLHMEKVAGEGRKGLGQGVMMLMGNGIGATAGIMVAGEVINRWCSWEMAPTADGTVMRLFMGDWQWPWLIFAIYTFGLLGAWSLRSLRFRREKPAESIS